ncbi:MAG: hypothetical protein QF473_21145, partial [Planctomycetota bacterium]|nr:hypothetical protein [Planctomycetota bacterium]
GKQQLSPTLRETSEMDDDQNLFGSIALRSDLLKQEQLKEALETQKKEKSEKMIGEILVSMRAMGHLDVKHVLDVQKLLRTPGTGTRFGIAVVQNGFAKVDEVERVLKKHGSRLTDINEIGQVMVQEGVISEEQMQSLLKGLHRLEGTEGSPRSRLVQAIRRIDQGGAQTIQYSSAEAMIVHDCQRLIKEGVKGIGHARILAEMYGESEKSFSLKELMSAGSMEKEQTLAAIDDLAILKAIKVQKKLLGTSYVLTDDKTLLWRIELLIKGLNNPTISEDLKSLLG